MPAAPAIDEVLADLARQTRRLRITAWVVGGAGLLGAAVLAGVAGETWMWRTVSAMTAPAATLVYLVAVLPLWRLRRAQALLPIGLPVGFTTAASPVGYARVVFVLAAAGFAWGAGATAVAITAVLLAVVLGLWPVRIVVTPGGLTVRSVRSRRVAWAQLADVRVTAAHGIDRLVLTVDRPGSTTGTVRVALGPLDVDRAFLASLLTHYRAVPEDRTAIGAPTELGRRRTAHRAAAAAPAAALRVDPGEAAADVVAPVVIPTQAARLVEQVVVPAQAVRLVEQVVDVIDPGADPGAQPAPALP
ncbi:hypothetical protein GCM10028775_09240 [Catellatospora paridis]